MGKLVNEQGNRYGRLVVLERAGVSKDRQTAWVCQCDCGRTTVTAGSNLRRGKAKSCGCGKFDGLTDYNNRRALPRGEASRRHLLSRYKDGARSRGYSYELTREEFDELTSGNCYYCGSPPLGETNVPLLNGSYKYNGIDRVDTTKGYTTDNCVSCCKRCNLLKRDVTPQIIERAYAFLLQEVP